MDFFSFLIWSFLFHLIAFGLSPSGLVYNRFVLFFYVGFFFHFIAFALSPSDLGYNEFFFFFDLRLLFLFDCLWSKSVGFRV